MTKVLFAVVAVCLVAGCGPSAELKKLTKEMLNDPESARFGEITYSTSGKYAAVNVNAKNRMGGYTGEQCQFFEKGNDGKYSYTTGLDRPCVKGDVEKHAKLFED